jgi:hypothetical protein
MQDTIKIKFAPFLIIAVVIGSLVFAGSLYDQKRTQEKVEIAKSHGQDIYKANEDRIKQLAKDTSDTQSLANVLSDINAPEGGNFRIHIISIINGEYRIRSGYQTDPLSIKERKVLDSTAKADQVTSTTEDFFEYRYRENNIIVFIPIKENNQLLGYMVVEVDRQTNL